MARRHNMRESYSADPPPVVKKQGERARRRADAGTPGAGKPAPRSKTPPGVPVLPAPDFSAEVTPLDKPLPGVTPAKPKKRKKRKPASD